METSPHPRARMTVFVAAFSAVLVVPYVFVGVDLALVVFGDRELDAHSARELATLGLSDQEASNLIVIALVALAMITAYALILSLGLYLRRQWARYGAILTYVFFGLVMLPLGIGGSLADPPAPNAWMGIVLGVADLAIPVLLLSEEVSDDFGDMEWLREREEHRPRPPDRDAVTP